MGSWGRKHLEHKAPGLLVDSWVFLECKDLLELDNLESLEHTELMVEPLVEPLVGNMGFLEHTVQPEVLDGS